MKKTLFILLTLFSISCKQDDDQVDTPDNSGLLQLASVKVGTVELSTSNVVNELPLDQNILISFTQELDTTGIRDQIILRNQAGEQLNLSYSYIDGIKTVALNPDSLLKNDQEYQIQIGEVKSASGNKFPGANFSFKTLIKTFGLVSASIEGIDMLNNTRIQNIPSDFSINLEFNEKIDPNTTFKNFFFLGQLQPTFQLNADQKNLTISYNDAEHLSRYSFLVSSNFKSFDNLPFEGFDRSFFTAIDSTFKFPQITDEELLTKVQEQTFKYFWDFAHPVSGLARERNTSGNTVTIGGSGFGVMSILVGIERGFITRQEGINRLETIVNFLENADRFHGVWPHWMSGNTGSTIPFGFDDDGADLVETAFMIQGLLTVREYLNDGVSQELNIKNKITSLWEEVEWDWFTQGGQNVLYWHWSPNFNWQKDLRIRGWNESLIIYVLAAASPTHGIDAIVYDQGWAQSGSMVNGNSYYNISLPVGYEFGGPLFFAHYSFLGLDPRNLSDKYADYWTQNVNHTLINRAHCIENPGNYIGYSEASWGITASDNHMGYSAHSPTNDLGVITPTAAISSFPYTPNESMDAIKHFYYLLGDKMWGEYGFYDAFNSTENWYANSYLAIDQGPIIVQIENHRSALLWNLFMSSTEVQGGLTKLGFSY